MATRRYPTIDDPGHPLHGDRDSDWRFLLEIEDPVIATRDHLEELLETAPSREAQAYVMGFIRMRETIAAVTGVEFS